jgi:hypothetical protein
MRNSLLVQIHLIRLAADGQLPRFERLVSSLVSGATVGPGPYARAALLEASLSDALRKYESLVREALAALARDAQASATAAAAAVVAAGGGRPGSTPDTREVTVPLTAAGKLSAGARTGLLGALSETLHAVRAQAVALRRFESRILSDALVDLSVASHVCRAAAATHAAATVELLPPLSAAINAVRRELMDSAASAGDTLAAVKAALQERIEVAGGQAAASGAGADPVAECARRTDAVLAGAAAVLSAAPKFAAMVEAVRGEVASAGVSRSDGEGEKVQSLRRVIATREYALVQQQQQARMRERVCSRSDCFKSVVCSSRRYGTDWIRTTSPRKLDRHSFIGVCTQRVAARKQPARPCSTCLRNRSSCSSGTE